MEITLDLPEDLLAAANVEAAVRGLTLSGFAAQCLRKDVAASSLLWSPEGKYFEIGELGFPVLKKQGASLTSEEVRRMLEENEEEELRRAISIRNGERSQS